MVYCFSHSDLKCVMQDEGLGKKLYYNDVYVYQNVKEVSSLSTLTSLSMVVRAAINQCVVQ